MNGFVLISDHTSAIESDKMYRQCDEKCKEAMQIFEQGNFYKDQGMYQKSKGILSM